MLYVTLRFLFKITVQVFFRNITIRNKEHIHKTGPILFVANHPSAFMDPIVLATTLDRKLYFLGKGILFKSKLGKWILPKFNTIPIYRRADDPGEMSKNEDTFRVCYEYLEKGAAILIFPEGITKTGRTLLELKTGAARIALGAEAKNNFHLYIQIIPVGLNYANPHKFNQDLYINISTPINISEYKELYTKDAFNAAQQLTETIRGKLEKLIIAINDQHTDELSNAIESLYKNKLSKELGIYDDDKNSSFMLSKNIVSAVDHFIQTDPRRAQIMTQRINEYFINLKRLGLEDADIAPNERKKSLVQSSLSDLLTIALGFPFYIYGLINNYLPFKIPGWIASRVASKREFIGSVGMSVGLFTFLIFYILQITFIWKLSHQGWLTVLYALSLPVSGLFAYQYYYTIDKLHAKWVLLTVFYKKSVLISNLITEREKIIAEFDKARNEYLEKSKFKQHIIH